MMNDADKFKVIATATMVFLVIMFFVIAIDVYKKQSDKKIEARSEQLMLLDNDLLLEFACRHYAEVCQYNSNTISSSTIDVKCDIRLDNELEAEAFSTFSARCLIWHGFRDGTFGIKDLEIEKEEQL